MDNHRFELYQQGQQTEQKFDYFICSVAGAFLAYLGKGYEPHFLHCGFALLEPISLLVLAFAFLAGIKRLEWCSIIIHIDHDLEAHREALKSNPNPQEAELQRQRIALLVQAQGNARIYYLWRDKLLIAAFLLVIIWKLASPYAQSA